MAEGVTFLISERLSAVPIMMDDLKPNKKDTNIKNSCNYSIMSGFNCSTCMYTSLPPSLQLPPYLHALEANMALTADGLTTSL